MAWTIIFNKKVAKELKSIDKTHQKRIIAYLKNKVVQCPTKYGSPLIGDKYGFWRYRIGDYRVICKIEHNELHVIVISIGHRKEIYNI